ncbi:MAG: extracellular solute-binding protein [Clostridia bacterium]|nr:extracellular solute-binding protein [Clostridia bacterium]
MKKIVSLMLALCLVLGMSAALADEKVELTAFQYALENQNTDFNNLWFFDELEAKTNTHVTFNMVKDADWSTQLNLMFADPKTMPDMILRNPVDVEEYGVSQGLLLPLDEYLTEEIMPNYVSRLKINNAGDSIPASDGKTYYIGYLMAQNVNHEGTWYVNTAEADKLQIETPKTIDEVTDMLRKMKADGIEYPFSASYTDNGPERIWNQFASFGVPENTRYYYIDENEKVQFTAGQDGWRACVEWLHTLYDEGLMDPESLTQDSNLWANKVNAGQVGYFTYLRLINTAIAADNIKNFKSILPPVADGCKAAVSSILEVPTAGAYLTSNCKDPVAALKWIDAQLETETMMVALNGKVGEQIVLNDEGKYEVINIPENNGLYDFVPVTMGQFFAPGDYYTSIYQMAPHRVERYEDSKAYAEAGVLEYKSFHYLRDLSKMSNEDSIEASDIYTELDKLVEESFADFVRNGVTDESWNAFQENAKNIGVERYIELYQNAYDAFLAK